MTTLAMADPFSASTKHELRVRQILNCMDEALLMLTLPESWQVFEKRGISGAVDLAWYQDAKIPQPLLPLAVRTKTDPSGLHQKVERLGAGRAGATGLVSVSSGKRGAAAGRNADRREGQRLWLKLNVEALEASGWLGGVTRKGDSRCVV